jgi:hypothetical protein
MTDASMDPASPRVGSPKEPITPEKPNIPAKKQLSSAQKASLARAREKARQSKLAKSQAKAEQEKQFAQFQKGQSPVKQAADEEMTESESEPSPSPVKKKKSKRHAKKKRKHYTTTDSDTSEDDPVDAKQRLADHAALAKQVYKDNLSRIKSDVVYKSLFPYLNN